MKITSARIEGFGGFLCGAALEFLYIAGFDVYDPNIGNPITWGLPIAIAGFAVLVCGGLAVIWNSHRLARWSFIITGVTFAYFILFLIILSFSWL